MHALVLTRKATRTFQPMSGAHNNDTAKAQGLVEVLQTVPLCSYRNQTKMMRMLVLAMGSTALSAAVVSNAYYKKQQFYPTVVYLLNSSRSMGVRAKGEVLLPPLSKTPPGASIFWAPKFIVDASGHTPRPSEPYLEEWFGQLGHFKLI